MLSIGGLCAFAVQCEGTPSIQGCSLDRRSRLLDHAGVTERDDDALRGGQEREASEHSWRR